MNPAISYKEGLGTFQKLVNALEQNDTALLETMCDADVAATTSHLGQLRGPSALNQLFKPPTSSEAFSLTASNTFIAGTIMKARVSAYLAGIIRSRERLAFGAIVLVDLRRGAPEASWQVASLKLQLTWIEGPRALRPGWSFPDHSRVWQLGDPLPLIVSELDAPWHLYPNNVLYGDDRTTLEDTYARYSWGIDQADFGLLKSCYVDDAAGTFQPLGPLTGRHAIIGVLKDFRRAWPMMQHHGEVLASVIDGDRAAMIVGRLIPQVDQPPGTYGAYYPLRLQRIGREWRIVWTEYRPNWFTRSTLDIPAVLAATLSGEGDRQA